MCGYGIRMFLDITTSFPHEQVSILVFDDILGSDFTCRIQDLEFSL
jgi:hypothetical protein